jgi:hypothetical protein
VEVTVSETVELKPQSFVYEITIGDAVNSFFNLPALDGEDDGAEITLDEVTTEDVTFVLDKEKFNYKLSSEEDYSISSSKKQPSILVDLENKQELNRLFKVFEDFEGINGSIQNVSYEDPAEHHEETMKALMCKAKIEAKSLAHAGSKELGDVISIQETVKEESGINNWFDDYQELIMNMGMGQNDGTSLSNKAEIFTYTYRFELL